MPEVTSEDAAMITIITMTGDTIGRSRRRDVRGTMTDAMTGVTPDGVPDRTTIMTGKRDMVVV